MTASWLAASLAARLARWLVGWLAGWLTGKGHWAAGLAGIAERHVWRTGFVGSTLGPCRLKRSTLEQVSDFCGISLCK